MKNSHSAQAISYQFYISVNSFSSYLALFIYLFIIACYAHNSYFIHFGLEEQITFFFFFF